MRYHYLTIAITKQNLIYNTKCLVTINLDAPHIPYFDPTAYSPLPTVRISKFRILKLQRHGLGVRSTENLKRPKALWEVMTTVDNDYLSYGLSLVSRMASFFYGIKFEEVALMMVEQMLSFPLAKRSQAEYLIRSFVTYMGDRVHKDRPINTFVLLIDEASAIEEHILQRYPNSEDVTSCARHALLIEDITYNGGAFHAALGISDSSVDPINETGSNRAIYDLVLPSRLDKTAIVTEILNKGNRSHLSPTHYHRLELIAATVNNNPRLVEIARDYISAKQTDVLIVDEEFVTGLYVHLDSEIESRYDGRRQFICPPDQLLRALVLGDDVKFDRENLKCITYSVITNSLDNFAVGQILV